jgi:hypothetical protein
LPGEAPTVSVSKAMIVFNGTDIQLVCTVTGSPSPNVTWYKGETSLCCVLSFSKTDVLLLVNLGDNDQRIQLNDIDNRFHVDTRTGTLSIVNSQRDDSGVYECFAQNILGSANARTNVLIRRSFPFDVTLIDRRTLFM